MQTVALHEQRIAKYSAFRYAGMAKRDVYIFSWSFDLDTLPTTNRAACRPISTRCVHCDQHFSLSDTHLCAPTQFTHNDHARGFHCCALVIRSAYQKYELLREEGSGDGTLRPNDADRTAGRVAPLYPVRPYWYVVGRQY